METKPLKKLLVAAVGMTAFWVQTSQAQMRGPLPPPPIGSGTGGGLVSGTMLPPPPIGSGTGGGLVSGTMLPPPPIGSGTGGGLVSGTMPPPPPKGSGTGGGIVSGTMPPPPPMGSGTSGTMPPPPPMGSGTGGSLASGTMQPPPPPPAGSGTNDPFLSGSDTPPPAPGQGPGTPPLPSGSVEALTEQLVFAPTGLGPAASIKGVFCAVSTSGSYQGNLNLVCGGLTSGTYSLSATLSTDESTVSIGTFVIGAAPAGSKPPKSQKVGFGGRGGIPFPSDLNPLDIASLTISDVSGTPLYTADLTTIIDGSWNAHIALVPGDGAPNALGFVDINAKAKQGKVGGCIAIHAKNLPASTTYTLSIDGTDVGILTTTSTGTLVFKNNTLAATVDLFSVKTVVVHDNSATTIFSADF